MYFAQMPKIYYEFTDSDGNATLKILTDITSNVRLLRNVLENITVYDQYDVVDGETPEIIAAKIYGNPLYHWVIMLANNRFDYRADFPLNYTDLLKKVKATYGSTDEEIYGVHHYEATVGSSSHIHPPFVVNSNYPDAYAVSNFEYEERVNEEKRRIKIISKQVLDAVVKEYSKMFM